jgi:hypothetical protein
MFLFSPWVCLEQRLRHRSKKLNQVQLDAQWIKIKRETGKINDKKI